MGRSGLVQKRIGIVIVIVIVIVVFVAGNHDLFGSAIPVVFLAVLTLLVSVVFVFVFVFVLLYRIDGSKRGVRRRTIRSMSTSTSTRTRASGRSNNVNIIGTGSSTAKDVEEERFNLLESYGIMSAFSFDKIHS